MKLADLMKRSELSYENLEEIDSERPELPKDVQEEVGIQIKYEGYIRLQEEQVEKFKKLEQKLLPNNIDYQKLKD